MTDNNQQTSPVSGSGGDRGTAQAAQTPRADLNRHIANFFTSHAGHRISHSRVDATCWDCCYSIMNPEYADPTEPAVPTSQQVETAWNPAEKRESGAGEGFDAWWERAGRFAYSSQERAARTAWFGGRTPLLARKGQDRCGYVYGTNPRRECYIHPSGWRCEQLRSHHSPSGIKNHEFVPPAEKRESEAGEPGELLATITITKRLDGMWTTPEELAEMTDEEIIELCHEDLIEFLDGAAWSVAR